MNEINSHPPGHSLEFNVSGFFCNTSRAPQFCCNSALLQCFRNANIQDRRLFLITVFAERPFLYFFLYIYIFFFNVFLKPAHC